VRYNLPNLLLLLLVLCKWLTNLKVLTENFIKHDPKEEENMIYADITEDIRDNSTTRVLDRKRENNLWVLLPGQRKMKKNRTGKSCITSITVSWKLMKTQST